MSSEYKADVVGSLLRPSYLLKAREDLEAGRLQPDEFKRLEDRAVDEAIALQEEVGLDLITDGEMRRVTFAQHLWNEIHGLEVAPPGEAPALPFHDHEREEVFQSPVRVVEKISRRRMLSVEEYTYARAKASRPIKVTLPSPLLLNIVWSQTHSTAAYKDAFELFADGAQLIREEVQELISLGCKHIQIDDPALNLLVDPNIRQQWEQNGISVDRVFSEGVELVNSIATLPGATFSLHLCKGNYRSLWAAQGGYDALPSDIFRRLSNFDRFLLEYDDERSGTFEPLANIPDDKVVVLGLISSKHGSLESVDDLLARIKQAQRYFPVEQLAVSTQCGFASVAEGNEITEEQQRAKLELVVEVARRLENL